MLDSQGNASLLPSIIRDIHKFTALWINKHDGMPGRKIWFNYWDKCITFEKSYFARLNYLWYNPIKHDICKNAEDYLFGSFRSRYFEEQDYIENLKSEYPWENVKEYDV
jgi:putative transposase